jgi:hypothetical protein
VRSTGASIFGCFFVARSGIHGSAPERVAEILNAAEGGFVPFEIEDGTPSRTVLYNRRQILTVALTDAEARRVPGYDVATPREVSVRLSNGRGLRGWIRVHRPLGRDRLSDWARHPDTFRYLEVGDATLVINMAHVVELSEEAIP